MVTKEALKEIAANDAGRQTFYQGFDVKPALSFQTISALTVGTVIRIVGFYIGGISYEPNDRTIDSAGHHIANSFSLTLKNDYLSLNRFKLAYLYVGRSDQGATHIVRVTEDVNTAKEEGEADAREAAWLAANLGIPQGSVIYLDVEGGDEHSIYVKEYVKKWVSFINIQSIYYAGIYCSAGFNNVTVNQLYQVANGQVNMYVGKWAVNGGECYDLNNGQAYQTSSSNPAKWFEYDPASAIPDVNCIIRQYSGNVYIKLNGITARVDQISSSVADPSIRYF